MSKTDTRFVDFRAVKAAVTMEQVLQRYGVLDRFKLGDDSLSGPCPIHKGSNPTQFRVSISKNCWNCFSDCHGGGNVLDFVARMENVPPMEAANRLVSWFQLDRAQLNAAHDRDQRGRKKTESEPQPRSPENSARAEEPVDQKDSKSSRPISVRPRTSPEDPGSNKPLGFQLDLDAAHPYLLERGLTPETIREFGVGYCAKGVMAGRIAIPIHNASAELVGYAGRWPGEPPESRPKYRLPDGFRKAAEIYRLSAALREPFESPLIIVEGFFDVMRLWQIGIRKSVALMGSSLSTLQEALLLEYVSPESKIIVMFDEDDAGREGREDAVLRLSRTRFTRVVTFAAEDFQPDMLTLEEAQLLNLR